MRPFTDVLRDMRKGRVVDAASEQLADVIRAVMFTGNPGEITLTLKVKQQGKGDNAVIVTPTIKAKIPRPDLPDALFFANLEGDLLREDPTHVRMFADAAETIDPETGEVTPNRRAV